MPVKPADSSPAPESTPADESPKQEPADGSRLADDGASPPARKRTVRPLKKAGSADSDAPKKKTSRAKRTSQGVRATKKSAGGRSTKRAPRKATKAKTGAERRRFRRLPLRLLVQYRYESVDDFVRDAATDISAGGLFIRTDSPHAEGSTIYLRFVLADGLPLIEGIGRVVRVNAPDTSNRISGMGVEFVSLDEDSRLLINSIIVARFADLDGASAGTG